MKIVFQCDGSDLLVDPSASFLPQLGWMPKIYGQKFTVVEISPNYDQREEIVFVKLQKFSSLNSVLVIKVWEQNTESLTLNKSYPIIRENETKFTIIDDLGREKHYRHDNFQFKKQ